MAGESAAERHSRGVTAYEKRLRGLFDELVDGTAHLKGAERMGAIDEIVRSLFLANVDVFTAADADMFEEMTGLQAAMPATEDMAKKADALVNIVRSRVWKQVYEGDESFRDAAFGPIQRNLRDGGRNLAIRSAEKHGILWARVPKGKTCAWCQMVASQGFVYSSEEAAGKAAKFHENCDCMIVPDTAEGHKAVKRLGFDIDGARKDYEAAAKAMRADGKNRPKGYDGKPVDADWYMRRMFPGKYTDGVPSASGSILGRAKKKISLRMRMVDIKKALTATNPQYGSGELKWRVNCQRCAPAYEMIRRGHDVKALPSPLTPTGRHKKADEYYWHHWQEPFVGMKWERTTGSGRADIEEFLKEWGDGARAEVYVAWKKSPKRPRGGAHVFVAENVDGSIIFVDPQSGADDVSRYFEDAKLGATMVARMDNLEPSEWLKWCVTEVEE